MNKGRAVKEINKTENVTIGQVQDDLIFYSYRHETTTPSEKEIKSSRPVHGGRTDQARRRFESRVGNRRMEDGG